ncbi:MAG: SDR family oxidoreductase [Gemmatimonadota bacterium]
MNLGLTGRVALVAASSRGIGRAIAEELGEEGADLVLCARSEERLEEVRRSLVTRAGVRVVAVPADISDPEAVRGVVEEGVSELGRIDVLVTNSGGPPAGGFESLSPEVWREAVRHNLESVLNFARAVLPGMKARSWGRIINITSIAVKQPVDNLMLSNSIRAAVTGFARTLANEVASVGITVNNVLPGYTRTRRLEELARGIAEARGETVAEVFAEWESETPMRRLGEPRELAAVVAFLASERAGYVTGTSITVDGGWVRSLF